MLLPFLYRALRFGKVVVTIAIVLWSLWSFYLYPQILLFLIIVIDVPIMYLFFIFLVRRKMAKQYGIPFLITKKDWEILFILVEIKENFFLYTQGLRNNDIIRSLEGINMYALPSIAIAEICNFWWADKKPLLLVVQRQDENQHIAPMPHTIKLHI